MNHDPLCRRDDIGYLMTPCICDVIDKVREEERHKRETHGPYFNSVVHECCERVQTERSAALRDAVEAIEALRGRQTREYEGERR